MEDQELENLLKYLESDREESSLAEKRRSKDLPFDLRPLSYATIEDLDLELFRRTYLPASLPREIIAENERSEEEKLTSLRFATVTQPQQPTILGILVVGNNPKQLLPGAYIQFMRIDGTELTDRIKVQKEISGPLPDLMRMLDETFQTHIFVASDMSKIVEKRQHDYPIVALQQLARNAVMHRTYESTNAPVRITWFNDRIEIQNPGGPFGQVNLQNFGQAGITDYRNRNIAEAMKNLGYVQKFGIGIQLARKELQKNGNPPPEFIVEDSRVLVILKPKL